MALQKIIQLQGDSFLQTNAGRISKGTETISFPAYIKVTSVTGNKSEIVAVVKFSDGDKWFEKQYRIDVSVADNSKNFIAQAYDHLKSLPEFLGAVDC